MLVIKVKDSESIDRALRRYKKKHREVNIMKELKDRRYFTKPSDRRRDQKEKARYRAQLQNNV